MRAQLLGDDLKQLATDLVGGKKRPAKADRMKSFMEDTADEGVLSKFHALNPKLAACMTKVAPCGNILMQAVIYLGMGIQLAYKGARWVQERTPINVLKMIAGVFLCFFGGIFVVSLTAIEAARNLGGEQLMKSIDTLVASANRVWAASRLDDQLDVDNDGIADVKQISKGQLAKRKILLVMQAVEKPDEVEAAVMDVLMAIVAILAAINLKFARATALALGIAEMVELPILWVMGPVLLWILGKERAKWCETLVNIFCKIVCIFFAWAIFEVIAGFYSALRGGKMFAEGFFHLLESKGWMDKLPDWCVAKPFDADNSYWDEAIGFSLAGAGFFWQTFVSHFVLKFPLNLALFPLVILEWLLKFAVVSTHVL